MAGVGSLVHDLFEAICNDVLPSGEARLLKLRCGIATGFPPMRSEELASRYRMTREQIIKRVGLALVKLPRGELETLKSYLDDEDHRFHKDLTSAQRFALRHALETGLKLQRMRKTLSTSITQTAESPSVTVHEKETKASKPSASSSRLNALGQLHQLLLPITSEDPSEKIFELLVLTQEWLNEAPLTYKEFWRKLLPRVAAHAQPQNVCDLWFVLGLFPAIDFKSSQNQAALMTVPSTLGVVAVRDHALRSVMCRVTYMPELIAVIAHSRRPTVLDLHTQLEAKENLSVDQIQARLKTLEALGAIRNHQGWSVTNVGRALSDAFPVASDETVSVVEISPATEASTLYSDSVGFLEL